MALVNPELGIQTSLLVEEKVAERRVEQLDWRLIALWDI
jgi:hypothetical protein